MRAMLLALFLTLPAVVPSWAAPPSLLAAPWRITRDHWSAADEQGFSHFVAVLGESGCSSSQSCLRDAANPWRDSDAHFQDADADCAKFPYLLRAYYAWKNGLPFSYVDAVAATGGSRADLRFGRTPNRPVSRTEILDRGRGIDGPAALRRLLDTVFTATYRTDAAQTRGVASDFYAPALQPGSIRPGTVIYDTNAHVGIVWKVDDSGRIHYMDAHPDLTVTRSVYGAQFGRSPAALGGGLKNWRPQRLVGARLDNGALVGGRIVTAPDSQIADFSLVQYLGNAPGGGFAYAGAPLGFYEYVRVAVSGGRSDFNPVYELQATMRTLCNDLHDRAQYIDQAVQAGLPRANHPLRLPENIYSSDDTAWESYATPSRDARLKAGFVAFRRDLAGMIGLWLRRDPRIVYDGLDLKSDLLRMYDAQSAACTLTYLSSDRQPVALSFDVLARHLFAMSFDPYDCIELRWGDDRASCTNQAAKRRWYAAAQGLRNDYLRADSGGTDTGGAGTGGAGTGGAGTGGSVGDLLARPAPPPPDTDIRGLIADMPDRVPFVQYLPGMALR